MLQIDPNKLKINLILDIAHHDKRGNHARPLRARHSRTDLAVPHIMRAHEQRPHGIRRHRQQQTLVLVRDGRTAADPVALTRVAQVLRVRYHVVEAIEFVVARLAHGCRYARVEAVRVSRFTAAEAVGAYAALAVL